MKTVCALPGCSTLVEYTDPDALPYCSAEHLAVANTLHLRDVLRQVVDQMDGEELRNALRDALQDDLRQVRGLESLPIRRSGTLD